MPDNSKRPQRTPSPGFRKRSPASKPATTNKPAPVVDTSARDEAHEAALLAKLEATHGCKLTPGQLKIDGATVRVGYLNEEAGLAFEIYPKQGGLNSGIKRKVSADVLKLGLLRQHLAAKLGDKVVCAVVLGDRAGLDDYLGKKGPSWMRKAAEFCQVGILHLG